MGKICPLQKPIKLKIMKNLEDLLKEIDFFVEEHVKSGKYVENELEILTKQLFELPKELIEDNKEDVEILLKKIICMGKSTGAFGFYDLLLNSNLSFSKELFVYGIDNEPYYNNNDTVFEKYLIIASQDTEVKDIINTIITQTRISRGHFFDYNDIFKKGHKLRKIVYPHTLPKDREKIVIHCIKNCSKFYQTAYKAILIAICFDLIKAVPFIEKLFKKAGIIALKRINNSYSGHDSFSSSINSIRDLSLVLYYFKKDEKYNDLFNLLNVDTFCKKDEELGSQISGIEKFFRNNLEKSPVG